MHTPFAPAPAPAVVDADADDVRPARPGAAGRAPAGKLAALFGLEGEGWLRHANPASVWTRFTVLPLLALAIWTRTWLGWWSLVPVALSLVWLFVNPLFFRPPRSTRNWASRSVLGERVWVERQRAELPEPFDSPVPTAATLLQVVGLVPLVYGLLVFDWVAVGCGVLIVQVAKLWYLDRMVLLYDAVGAGPGAAGSWSS